MKKIGFKLSASDIYNVNQSSLKDAIVSMGFCTGEMISADGLMLTNHHCGYGSIQYNSTVEHDYLTDGFVAKTKEEELQSPEIVASFLVRMEDVTPQILAATHGLSGAEKDAKMKEFIKLLRLEFQFLPFAPIVFLSAAIVRLVEAASTIAAIPKTIFLISFLPK